MAAISKGVRDSLVFWTPVEHKATYKARAKAAGLFMGDYAALVFARVHNLEDPDYIHPSKRRTPIPSVAPDPSPEELAKFLEENSHQLKDGKLPFAFRFPRAHRPLYEKRAHELDLAVLTYFALVMARVHGLEDPANALLPPDCGPIPRPFTSRELAEFNAGDLSQAGAA